MLWEYNKPIIYYTTIKTLPIIIYIIDMELQKCLEQIYTEYDEY